MNIKYFYAVTRNNVQISLRRHQPRLSRHLSPVSRHHQQPSRRQRCQSVVRENSDVRTVDVSTNLGCVTERTTVGMGLMKLTVQVCSVVDEFI